MIIANIGSQLGAAGSRATSGPLYEAIVNQWNAYSLAAYDRVISDLNRDS